jgi:hypothetical protein
MVEIPRRKLLGMTMAVFGFFTTLSNMDIDRAAMIIKVFIAAARQLAGMPDGPCQNDADVLLFVRQDQDRTTTTGLYR